MSTSVRRWIDTTAMINEYIMTGTYRDTLASRTVALYFQRDLRSRDEETWRSSILRIGVLLNLMGTDATFEP